MCACGRNALNTTATFNNHDHTVVTPHAGSASRRCSPNGRSPTGKDNIDSRLNEYLDRAECNIHFRRLNRGWYAFRRRLLQCLKTHVSPYHRHLSFYFFPSVCASLFVWICLCLFFLCLSCCLSVPNRYQSYFQWTTKVCRPTAVAHLERKQRSIGHGSVASVQRPVHRSQAQLAMVILADVQSFGVGT